MRGACYCERKLTEVQEESHSRKVETAATNTEAAFNHSGYDLSISF
jgi:hypothetical protein